MKHLTLLRSDGWVTVDPCPRGARAVLEPLLTFREKEWKQGAEKAKARRAGLPLVTEQLVHSFVDDQKGRITFPFGFAGGAMLALERAGYPCRVEHLTPHPRPEIFEPQWGRIFERGIRLRPKQAEFLAKVVAHDNGRFSLPTGWGKSFMIRLIALMWPRARIAVVAKSVTVIRDRIYPELATTLADVGIIGGGQRRRGRRVMCITADSLRWFFKEVEESGPFDVLIVDECHRAAADDFAYQLGQVVGPVRMYGLSATQDMRADGKDHRVRGLFGPLRFKIPYQEAVKDGAILQLEVRVSKVVMDVNPCAGLADEEKLRAGVWRNNYRNDLILRDALRYAARGKQVMICCAVLEHVLALRRRFERLAERGEVPAGLDLACVYRQHDSPGDYSDCQVAMRRRGLGKTLARLPRMTLKRRLRLTRRIERGAELLAAVTTVFNEGFDPKALHVLWRADCGSGEIASHQLPGRNSRPAEGKEVGIVRDCDDKFDRGLGQRFKNRRRVYRGNGWRVVVVRRKRTALAAKMHWED